MADGFLPYILMQSRDIFANPGTPSRKLTPKGFLNWLLSNDMPTLVNTEIADGSGHLRDIKFKYRTRGIEGESSTDDNCEVDVMPAFLETTVPGFLYRKIGIFFDDATIAKYEKAASQMVSNGTPASQFPAEIWESVLEKANGLLADINNDLIVAQGATFGKNKTTGLSTAKTINFDLNGAQNDLSAGMTMLMDDLMENEIRLDNSYIVGSGLINKYYVQHVANAKSANQSGLDTSRLALPQYYFDPKSSDAWGVNQFGVFEKNSVQLINVNLYQGYRAGDKMKSIFGTITLPVVDSLGGGNLQKFKFDYQLTYYDCPQTIVLNGENTNIGRGYVLTLSCNYNLFNIPADAYQDDDVLTGNNGTLLYEATNA